MNQPDRSLDRVGAIAGAAFLLLFVGVIMFAPALPPPNHSIDEIATTARNDARGLLVGNYVGLLSAATLLVFGACVSARLRRAEGALGGWWIIALTGVAGTAVAVVGDLLFVSLVRAVGHGVSGETLWVGYPAGPDGILLAIPLAVFLFGAGMGARASGALPSWLGWLGVAIAGAFVIGAGGVTGDEVDGGALGAVLFFGYAALAVWVVGTSVSLWRGAGTAGRVPAGREVTEAA